MIAKIVVLVMVLATAGLASAPSASAACDWTNPQSFVDSVLILDNNFVLHDPGSAAYQPPTGQALNLNPQSPIAQDLFNAFEKASPSFRQKLCGSSGVQGLSAIFVNARGCGQNDPTQCRHTVGGPNFNRAWGFRSHPDPITGRTPPDSGDTYISISAADLWQNGSYARPLHNYETEILKSFQGWNGALALPATPDDSWMSVLAALAHEVGHVRWAEVTIPQPGDDYDLSLLTMCPQGDFFAG